MSEPPGLETLRVLVLFAPLVLIIILALRGIWKHGIKIEDDEPEVDEDLSKLSEAERYRLWREELAEWTDHDGTSEGLQELLDRWDGIPHGKPKVTIGVDLAKGTDETVKATMYLDTDYQWKWRTDEIKELKKSVEKYARENSVDGKFSFVKALTKAAAPQFEVGQWVRRKEGKPWAMKDGVFLFQVIGLRPGDAVVKGSHGTLYAEYEDIEPALPKKGEWWMWTACDTCKDRLSTEVTWTFGPSKLEEDLHEDHPTNKRAAHGCCVPYKFGLGEEAKG